MSILTLQNQTGYPAHFLVKKGDQVIAHLPALAPQARLQLPSNPTGLQIVASTQIEGKTYTAPPVASSGPEQFLAQIIEVAGGYEFQVVALPSTQADQLQFQKTTAGPVTFALMHGGQVLQSVVVSESFMMVALNLSDTYLLNAVINGITTPTVTTTNPNATITAVAEHDSTLPAGYYSLVVS